MAWKYNPFTGELDNTGSGSGSGTVQFNTDSGSATTSSGSITIAGAGSVSTSGTGSTVTITGSNTKKEYWFAAENLEPLETNSAVITKITGTNVKTLVGAFDDTTEEYLNGKLQVPGDVDTSGTVTFRAYVYAATAATSKNIALTFGHVALNDSDDFDVAYTDEDSGDIAIDATQDNVTEATWTETISNLSWAANDLVLFRLSRPQASANNLTGDMYLMSLCVEIPRTA